ncbi:MAG TPA: hypothetical protein PLU88_07720, partial [Armatimonadota bacterium]|nr:hypothetical protein [Armatimonadota bacterium]
GTASAQRLVPREPGLPIPRREYRPVPRRVPRIPPRVIIVVPHYGYGYYPGPYVYQPYYGYGYRYYTPGYAPSNDYWKSYGYKYGGEYDPFGRARYGYQDSRVYFERGVR